MSQFQILMIGQLIFIATLTGALAHSAQLTDAPPVRINGIVTTVHPYSATIGGLFSPSLVSASYLTIHLANGTTFNTTVSCNYYHVNDTLTLSFHPYRQDLGHEIFYVLGAPDGCNFGVLSREN